MTESHDVTIYSSEVEDRRGRFRVYKHASNITYEEVWFWCGEDNPYHDALIRYERLRAAAQAVVDRGHTLECGDDMGLRCDCGIVALANVFKGNIDE